MESGALRRNDSIQDCRLPDLRGRNASRLLIFRASPSLNSRLLPVGNRCQPTIGAEATGSSAISPYPHERPGGNHKRVTAGSVACLLTRPRRQLKQPTPTPKVKTTQNAKTGVPGALSLHRAELSTNPSMRRRATPGTHGEHLSNRLMADAVGRRGRFPEGRLPPDFRNQAPPGNAPSGDDRQSLSLRQPSAHATRFAGPSLSARQPFGLAPVPMRPRRPGSGTIRAE